MVDVCVITTSLRLLHFKSGQLLMKIQVLVLIKQITENIWVYDNSNENLESVLKVALTCNL